MYVAAVNRDGGFRLHVRSGRGGKLLREARLDLDTLLAPRPRSRPAVPLIDPTRDPSLPAILRVRPFPLRLPHGFDPERAWPVQWNGREHVLALTKDRRLMLWDEQGWAARQVSDSVPAGPLHWCECRADEGRVQAVVGTLGLHKLHLLTVDLEAVHSRCVPLNFDGPPSPPAAVGKPQGVAAHGGMLFVFFNRHVAVCERAEGTVCSWVPLSPSTRWQHGRFLLATEKGWCEEGSWFAEAYDGGGATRSECIYNRNAPRSLNLSDSIILMVEPPGGSGPVGLTESGCLFFTGAEPELRDVLPGVRRVTVLAVSRTGERIVVAAEAMDPEAPPTIQVINLADNSVSEFDRLRAGPAYYADPILRRRVQLQSVRRRFTAVTVDMHDALVLIGRRYRGWSIRVTASDCLMLMQSSRPEVPFAEFRHIAGPPGVGYGLKAAVFADGSRVVLDSRGLLHLQSSDPALPQATLVLSGDSALAGWCSDGRVFGPEYFTGDRADASPAAVLREVLQPFVRRLR
jgi:hypothetical protein